METRKLYYEDCHLREFDAVVTGTKEDKKGSWVCLDATAFFPEGGGQAWDLGYLNEEPVLEVKEADGIVWHLLKEIPAVGASVKGKLDWVRRLDLMQQHTGEHIVSGIIHKMFGYQNVGFHVGAEITTIDFDGMIPQDALRQIEEQANQAIYENLPVNCWYPEESILATLPYRTKKQLPWPVRIVEIPGYDMCACCGVHVKQTGEVGIIKLLSCVKFHQGVRIEMTCGARAWNLLWNIFEQNRQVSQAFSAKILETGEAAQRMNEALAQEKFRSNNLQSQVFDTVAEKLGGQEKPLYFTEGLPSGQVRELADKIAKVCAGNAAVFSGNDREGYSLCLVGELSEKGKALTQTLGGRGGGKPGFFQGSTNAKQDLIAAFFNQ